MIEFNKFSLLKNSIDFLVCYWLCAVIGDKLYILTKLTTSVEIASIDEPISRGRSDARVMMQYCDETTLWHVNCLKQLTYNNERLNLLEFFQAK
jgi:hypothetical protein